MEVTARTSEAAVFISYSRRDSADFVDELHISLETCGFNCYFDKQDIASGEDWELRLGSLISGAETTVCIITEAWVSSTECVKELEIALKLGRRVIPVLKQEIDPARLPSALSRLQFVFFCGEGHTYARGVASLVRALKEDLTWIRAQSRYLALAYDWQESSKRDAYLLRGAALEDALEWFQKPTPDRVNIPPLITDFLTASENAESRQARRKFRSRLRQMGMASVTLISVMGAGIVYAWDQKLDAQDEAEVAFDKAQSATEEAEAAEAALIRTYNEPEYRMQQQQIQMPVQQYQVQELPDRSGSYTRELPPPAPPPIRGEDEEISPPERSVEVEEDVVPADDVAAEITLSELVNNLNSRDRETRLAAGQQVANLVREDDNEAILVELSNMLTDKRIGELSSSGRFNVLYMLNIADGETLRDVLGPRLTRALIELENRASRTKGDYIGTSTRDCLSSLTDKLSGGEGKETCGGQ